MKKILAVVLALAMVLGLGTVAFAAGATDTVEVSGSTSVTEGTQATYTATCKAADGDPADSDNTVTWSLTGNALTATNIDANTGVLTVAMGETGSLTVKATTPAGKVGQATVSVTKAVPNGKNVAKDAPKIEVSTSGTLFDDTKVEFYILINTETGTYYFDTNANGKQDDDEATISGAYIKTINASDIEVIDDKGNSTANNKYEVAVAGSGSFKVTAAAGNKGASKLFVNIKYTEVYGDVENNKVYNTTIEKKADENVQDEIKRGLKEAVDNHSTIATFDINELTDLTVSSADWKYITNTWAGGDWYDNFNYLGMTLRFVNHSTGTVVTIKADDLDYTWNKPVDFRETNGLVKYDKTEAEMYNVIRAITGDTKNPYTFGFSQMDNTKDRGTSVPTMTISKVVPQKWINYYGHKSLYLFAWDAGINCDNWAHNDPKVLAETTMDLTTLDQRVEFTTSNLYKTIVLAAKAPADTEKPAGDKTDDANPNTGANDIVNVAIVFAVVSLAAAGAFVFKKAK